MKIIINLLLLINLSLYSQNLNDLYLEAKADSSDVLILTFEKFENCNKCLIQSQNFKECLKERINNQMVHFITAINCDRKIELNIFRKNFNYNGHLIQEKHTTKENLNLKETTKIAIFKNKQLLAEFNYEEIKKLAYSCRKAIMKIKTGK